MKKFIPAVLLVASMFLFTGCPYDSDVPITQPSLPVSKKIIGVYEDKKNHDVYKVTQKDETTYKIESGNDTLYAFASLVGEVTFINLWSEEQKPPVHKYSFYKLEMDFDLNITLSEITENITEKFSKSEDLKKFIAANMHNSYFFGKEKIFLTRIGN